MNVSEIIFRLTFVVLNLLIMVGGVILVIVGGILISLSSSLLMALNDIVQGMANSFNFMVFLNSAIVLIVVGIILILIGLVGTIGAIKHKIFAFLLIGYLIVLVVIIVLQIVGVILAFVYQVQLLDAIQNGIGPQLLQNYPNDTGIQKAVDFIQNTLSCCGVNDTYRDYTTLPIPIPIPTSCSCALPAQCVTVTTTDPTLMNNVTMAYASNCVTTIESFIGDRTYQYILGGIGIAFLVFEILLILFGIWLIFLDFKGSDE